MNDTQISMFLDLAKTCSFTKTAENKKASQPTVTRNIILLEKELGTKLFDRTKRSVMITDDGRRYSRMFRKWEKDLKRTKVN